MGNFLFRKPTYSSDPNDYYVHGLNYWPGKPTSEDEFHTLLPNYRPPNQSEDTLHSDNNNTVLAHLKHYVSCEEGKNGDHNESTSDKQNGDVQCNSIALNATEKLCDLLPLNKTTQMSYQPHTTSSINKPINAININEIGAVSEDHSRHDSVSQIDTSIQIDGVDLNFLKTRSDVIASETNTVNGSLNIENDITDHDSRILQKDIKPEDEWLHWNYSCQFENIALSGGGIKGYAYIGAVKALEDAGIMKNIKRFSGASSGAMCAASLALGYSAQEMCRCFFVDLVPVLNDQTCACILCVPKLYKQYGIHPARKLMYWYGEQIAAKTGGNPDLTFKEHHERFDKELCIVVCNITKMTTEYCHHTTTPDLPIREAVRMSMAVPVVYEPVKKDLNGQTNYYIDGGIGDHFPIHVYDGAMVGANLNAAVNKKTIGFYTLSERDADHVLWKNTFGTDIPKPTYMPDTKLARGQLQDEIKRRKKSQKNFDEKKFMKQLEKFSRLSMEPLQMQHYETHNKTQVDTSNFLSYLFTNLELMINAQVMRKMKPKDVERTVLINVGYMETHSYALEPPDREFMIKQAYESTKHFLHQCMERDKTEQNLTS